MRTNFSFGPLLLTNTLTTNLLGPGDTNGGVNAGTTGQYATTRILLRHLWVLNSTNTPQTVSLWLGLTGANTAGTEFVWQSSIVPAANNTLNLPNRLDFYDQVGVPLDYGLYVVGGASANSSLTLMGTGEIIVR